MRTVLILISTIFVLFIEESDAQEKYPDVTVESEGRVLTEVLVEIEEKYDLTIFFDTKLTSSIIIDKNYRNIPLNKLVTEIFKDHNISLILTSKGDLIIFNHQIDQERNQNSNRLYQFDDRWILGDTEKDSNTVSITGYIRDIKTGENLIGATILFDDQALGVSTDTTGYFSIKLKPGEYILKINYLGYEPIKIPVIVRESNNMTIELAESPVMLESVMISAESDNQNITSTDIGLDKLNKKTISLMPAFLGEADVIKSLLMLPGVSTVGEGASGFNVRGGSVDQNLILMDDMILYNPSHLFGFFSVFNPDLVNQVNLYKGTVPPKYGGRISSVLDVQLKNELIDKIGFQGGLGIVSARLGVDVPVVRNKNSISLGARFSYSDWLLRATRNLALRNSSAKFYDVTAKYSHSLTDRDHLYLTGYTSKDAFKFANDTLFTWGQSGVALKWEHSGDRIFSSVSVIANKYWNGILDERNTGFDFRSKIFNYSVKGDFSYDLLKNHELSFGGITTFHIINKGNLYPGELSYVQPFSIEDDKAVESAVYVSDKFEVKNNLSVLYGIRFSNWTNLGPAQVFKYTSGIQKSRETIIDSVNYSNNQIITSYFGIEPRLAINYILDPGTSFKVGYNRSIQYLHLLSNTTAVTPTDQWQISNFHFKPQFGDQFSLGYFKNLGDDTYKLSGEAYYKSIKNIMDFKEGSKVLLNDIIETDVLKGIGKYYGLELMVKKVRGKFNGWLGYTFSRSFLKIKGINEGEFYPSNYDKPHDISTFISYRVDRHVSISANFTYSTGRPITVPTSKYRIENFLSVIQYSGRNQYRIPDYHRLDLSLTIENLRKRDKYKGSWVITIFNVYSRKNPYSVFFNQYGFAKRLSVLGTIFPSLTYNFELM